MLTILRRPPWPFPLLTASLTVLRPLLMRRRATRMERLADLNDHLLRDIGLERGAVLPSRPSMWRQDRD